MKLTEFGEPALRELERRYAVKREDLDPRVFYRLTGPYDIVGLPEARVKLTSENGAPPRA